MSVAAVRRMVNRFVPDRPPTDAELVAAIAPACTEREAAFAELVARHGPTVLGVCRRVLADAHDAEDAFQAVFLVLARKAKSIRPPGAVGGWLYGVAVRTARKAKTAAARRRRREMIATVANPDRQFGGADGTSTDLQRAELRAAIDAELAALPATHRAAVVLCDLHGKTRAEAATELDRPEGTVAAWLARGRKALAARLARRGIALPSAGLVAVVAPSTVSAELASSALATFLGRGATAVVTLAESVTRGFTTGSTKLSAVLATAGALLLAVATAAAWQPREAKPEEPTAPTSPIAAPAPKPESKMTGFSDHKGYVYAVSYAPGSKSFLSVGNGSANVWDVDTRKKLFTVDAEFAQFAADGKSLFLFTKADFLIADPATGKAMRKFARGAPKPVVGGRWATCSEDGEARVEFDGVSHTITNYPIGGLTPPLKDQQKGIAFSAAVPAYGRGGAFAPGGITRFAGIHRATTDHKETACLTVWQLHEGHRIGTISRTNQGVQAFAWSPDGKQIAVAYNDSVRVYSTNPKVLGGLDERGDEKGPFRRDGTFDVAGTTAVAWSKDGKQLAVAVQESASASVDNGMGAATTVEVARTIAVLLLDAATGKELRRIEGFPDNLPIVSLAFRPDGKQLVTGAGFFPNDGPASNGPQPAKDAPGLRVIPLDEPKKPASAWKETSVVDLTGWLGGSVDFALDGKTVFVGGTDGNVHAYDAGTRKKLWEYKSGGAFAGLAVGGEKMLATITHTDLAVTAKGGVVLIDPATGKVRETLTEKGVDPVAVAWFPGRRVPNMATGELIATDRKLMFGTATGYTAKRWGEGPKVKLADTLATVSLRNVADNKKPADEYAVPLAIGGGGRGAIVTGPVDPKTGKNILWMWGAGGGAENTRLDGHKAAVVSAAWSANDETAVTGDADGLGIIWEVPAYKEKARLNLGGRVAALAFTGDGKTVAAAVIGIPGEMSEPHYREEVFVWAAGAKKKPEPISSHAAGGRFKGFASVAFAPDGKTLVSAFANSSHLANLGDLVGKVRLFALPPDKPAPAAKTVSDVSFSLDGTKHLVVSDGRAEVFDTATGKRLFFIDAETARFSADGAKLFVLNDQIHECDTRTGKITKTHARPKTKWMAHRAAFAPDGKRLVAHFGLHAGVYDVATGKEGPKLLQQFETAGWLQGSAAQSVAFSADGKYVIALGVKITEGGQMGAVVWDAETGKWLGNYSPGAGDTIRAVALTPTGGHIAVALKDRIAVYATGKFSEPTMWKTDAPVTALAYSADGKRLAVGVRESNGDRWWADVRPAYNGAVRVYEVLGGKELRTLRGFKRDSVLLLRGEAKEPTEEDFRGHRGTWIDPLVSALAFSADGKKLLAGSGFPPDDVVPAGITKGGEVKLFDLTAPAKPAPAGRQWTDAATVADHKGLVNGVTVAPDGTRFAAATENGVFCWDATTRKLLWTHKLKEPDTFALAYSPDGKHLCVATKFDVMRLSAKTGEPDPWTDDNAIWFGKVGGLAYHPDGTRLAASDGYVTRVRELGGKGTEVRIGKHLKGGAGVRPASVAWSKDGKRLALVHETQDGDKYAVTLWDVDSKEQTTKLLSGHPHPVTAVAWTADGKAVASGDEKGTVILWDAATGRELWRRTFRGRDDTDGRINALALAPTDNTVAVAVSMGSGKGPERVVLLAGTDGKDVEHLMGAWSLAVTSVAWAKDGTRLVTACGSYLSKPLDQDEKFVGEVVVWERKP